MYLNKLGKRSLSLLTILVALSSLTPATPAAAQTEPQVAIEPSDLTVQPGQAFTVTVTVVDVSDLGGYEIHLGFDPAVVEVAEAEDGGFLESSGRSLLELGTQIDAQAGTAVVGAVSLGQGPGAEGSGELVRFSLRAVGAGESDLDLLDERVTLLDTAGGTIPFSAADGRVRVASGGAGTPSPSATGTLAATPTEGATGAPTATPGATSTPTEGETAVPTATPSRGATSAPTATPSEQPTMSGATATKTVTDADTLAPTATIAGSEDQASSVPSATADQTSSETRPSEATEVPQTDEAEEEASSTSTGTPAAGATEAPAISATRTAEAPAEGPGPARRRGWLIAAALLAALGAALIGGGVLRYSGRRRVDGDAFVEDEREMDDGSLQADDPDRAGGGAS